MFSNKLGEKSPDLVTFPWISGKFSKFEISMSIFRQPPPPPLPPSGQIGYGQESWYGKLTTHPNAM